MIGKTLKHILMAAAIVLHWGIPAAFADTPYPNGPVRLVVPFPAGGPTDLFARLLAQELSKQMGQQFVVINKAGAGGNIGAVEVARAAADGYTLLMGTSGTHGINMALYKRPGYDAIKDFAPISPVSLSTNLLVVNPNRVKATSVKELIAYAKQNPDSLLMASSGSGTTIHLSGELFKAMTGTDMRHVPYRGSAAALTDLIGGQVDLIFDNFATVYPHVKSGTLRALAVTAGHRVSAAPAIPTVAEAGVPGYEASVWFGLFAPANTPEPIIRRLNDEVRKALASKEIIARFARDGAEPYPLTPGGFAELIRRDLALWGGVVKRSGATAD
jgi:tripartite-type tricarboxylate transporter receptor subunit TctC